MWWEHTLPRDDGPTGRELDEEDARRRRRWKHAEQRAGRTPEGFHRMLSMREPLEDFDRSDDGFDRMPHRRNGA